MGSRSCTYFGLTFPISGIAIYIIFQEQGRDQQKAVNWGSLPVVEGIEPASFTSKRPNIILLAIAGQR